MFRREVAISFPVVLIILASVPLASCVSSPPIIYVAGDGSGDYNCNGKSDQIQINQALQFVAKNNGYTTVHLKGPFTYVIDGTILIGSNTILEGDSTTVIKLANHAGWSTMKPLIQQLNIKGDSDITVRGFEVDVNYAGNSEITLGKGYYNVMYFTYSNNIRVYNMYMHDGTGDGLRANKCKNIQFYDNTIYKLGHDGMFAINSENVEAWNNRITCRTNSALRVWNSIDVKLHDNVIDSYYHWSAGGPGIQIEKSTGGTVSNVEVYGNTINNTYGPGIWLIGYGDAYPMEEARNVSIHNNIFYLTGTNPSIYWVGGIVTSGFYNTIIENNIFDGIYNAAIIAMYPADHTNLAPQGEGYSTIARNNIIVNTLKRTKEPGGTGEAVINYEPGIHFFMLENNCLYNNEGGDYKNCSATTDIYVNPLVADMENHDYRLQSTGGRWDGKNWVKDDLSSLCIDAGYPYSDYFNEPEPNGKRVNIGPDGNTIYASKSELVTPPTFPTANFSSNVTGGIVPLTVQFIDLSNNATVWKWDFGDGTNSTQQNPIHIYSEAEIYNVTLTVNNVNGMDSKSRNISAVKSENTLDLLLKYNNRLRESTPKNTYSNNSYLDVGGLNGVGRYRDVIWFDLSSTGANQINNAALSLTWYYPSSPRINDTIVEIYRPASTWNPDYVSWNKKDNKISWNNSGGDWYDKNGILQGNTPYASFTLKASSLPSNTNCEFDVTNLVREYISGKYPNTGFFIKARSESDNYIAYYSADCKLHLSTPILPKANFSSNVTGGYAPLSVQFTDLSENATTWNWDFGDGTNSTQQNPVHTYSASGNYIVNLTAINGNGKDSKLATITVVKAAAGSSAYITNGWDNLVSVIDTATNNVTATVKVGNRPWGIAASSDGKKVYVTNVFINSVSVIETSTNTVKATINGFNEPWGIAVSPDGTKVYVANSGSNKVSVINTVMKTVAATVTVGNNPRGVAVSTDGTKVYVTNQNNNTVSVIDSTTNTVSATVNAGVQPWGVAVSPDDKKVYVANYGSNTVTVIDTATNTASATVLVGPNPVGVALTPDGTKVYVTNFGSNTVSLIDTATNRVTKNVEVGNNPYGVSFTPDGKKAYVACQNSNNVSVIDTATSAVTATVNVGRSVALGQFIISH